MSFETETGRDLYFKQLEKELAELIDPGTGLLDLRFAKVVPCPLCENSSYQTIFIKRGYTFVRCNDCHLVFSNPQVIPELVEKTYRHDLSSTELWMNVLLNQKEIAWRNDYYGDALSIIENHVPKGKLLDVGCAVGHFLQIARQRKWQTIGIELSNTASQHCINNLGLEVYQKTIKEASFDPNSFDAITLFGVLEHVANPLQLLKQVWSIVRPGGIVTVVVPNLYSLLNLFLREKAVTFDGRNHLIYFSQQVLEKCMRMAGLEVVRSDTLLTGLPNIIRYIQFLDPYSNHQDREWIPPAIRSFLDSDNGFSKIEKDIAAQGLGLRIRMLGRKPKKEGTL